MQFLKPTLPILMLLVSNVFMTFAWYGHLKFKSTALWVVILSSWAIALFEYIFQVPANRLGSNYFTTAQLKIIQEVITLTVFSIFSVLYLKEKFTWNYFYAFLCILGAVFFIFKK
ncbi:MAG: DMT family protein [Clostridia bacterium]|nr:DMT family protein [Clostridia bacterium]